MRKLMLTKRISLVLALLLTLIGVGALALAEEAEDQWTTDVWGAEEVLPEEEVITPVYTLIFLDDAGEVLVEEKLTEGDRIVRPFFVPTRAGYNFLFWYSLRDLELTKEVFEFEFGNGIMEDTVLSPFYEAIPAASEPWGGNDLGSEEGNADEDGSKPVILPQVTEPAPEPNKPAPDSVPESDLNIQIIDDPVYEEGEEQEDEALDGEDLDGETLDGEELDGETLDGETLDGEALNGETLDGETLDGEALNGEVIADGINEEAPVSPATVADFAVNVFSSHGENIQEGEILRVWAELVGFAAEDAQLQWQYSTDGLNWYDAEGATGLEHSFEANGESVNYSWRLSAKIAVGGEQTLEEQP